MSQLTPVNSQPDETKPENIPPVSKPDPQPKPEDILDSYIDDLSALFVNFLQINVNQAKDLAKLTIDNSSDFIEEHINSPNFLELSKHHASQLVHDAAQQGIRVSNESQRLFKEIVIVTLSNLKYVIAFIP